MYRFKVEGKELAELWTLSKRMAAVWHSKFRNI